MKKLNELLPVKSDLLIESITSDSRFVKPNSIFFCLDGLSVDGHQFVEEAIYKGAVCIVHSKELPNKKEGIVYYYTHEPIACLNKVACKFYDHPSKSLKIVGVTGTNGKTIVSSLIYQASHFLFPLGYIGTRHVIFGNKTITYAYTTPEVIFLQEYLRKMVDANMKGACLEVSSIGLALGRVQGVDFDIAIFTNFSPEHLDFHGSLEEYQNAKLKLFKDLKKEGIAIINRDDEEMFNRISSLTQAHVLTYGLNHEANIRAKNVHLYLDHSDFDIEYNGQIYPMHTHLLGEFNIYHIIASVLALVVMEVPIEKAIESISQVQSVDGRLELVDTGTSFHTIIDDGHTPEHYEQIFKFASSVKQQGRIIAVFGSEGKKDIKKRAIIGQMADKYCDHIILTEEDPRDEDPEKICNEIRSGIKKVKNVIITDRETAIYQAAEIANPHDIILIIGKGDETTMLKEDGKVDYIGDKQALKNAIEEIYGGYDEELE